MRSFQPTRRCLPARSAAGAATSRHHSSPSTSDATLSTATTTTRNSTPLTSSTQLWEAAVHDFYDHCSRLSKPSSSVLGLTKRAQIAMERCLAARRAQEALEVYATLCRCGLLGMAAITSPRNPSGSSMTASLDALAQQATQQLPHRRCQQSMVSLILAAEGESMVMTPVYGHTSESVTQGKYTGMPDGNSSDARQGSTTGRDSYQASLRPLPSQAASTARVQSIINSAAAASGQGGLLPRLETFSQAEQARLRVQRRLLALHRTQQLDQPLGKAYCLVEMHQLCTDAFYARSRTESDAEREEISVEAMPLYTLSRHLLAHPFAFNAPTAAWAQQTVLWEGEEEERAAWIDKHVISRPSAAALSIADAARLTEIECVVRPYRRWCRSALQFLSVYVPQWDALLVRRVAEALVLPAAAHNIFPVAYRRVRARGGNVGSVAPLTSQVELSENRRLRSLSRDMDSVSKDCGNNRSSRRMEQPGSVWTGTAVQDLFSPVATTAGSTPGGRLLTDPLRRVEALIRRRVHHDVVVPDAAYVLQRFHQLWQLGRHREIIITHGVFLEIVSAAAATAQPSRFHARRVLREVMTATTTAATSAALQRRRSTSQASRGSALERRHMLTNCGFTLLGLQDELALLECCPERFFLESHDTSDTAHGLGTPLLSTISVVLVAIQLGRLIAAHDRGEDVDSIDRAASTAAASTQSRKADEVMRPSQGDSVDDFVRHILGEDGVADGEQELFLSSSSGGIVDAVTCTKPAPLFRSRSRHAWARQPALVATTGSDTRAAAFTVGVSMYPPAAVAP